MAYYGRHPNNYTNCRLEPHEVQTIRLWYDSEYKSLPEIASEFNIVGETVRRIGKREMWTNIPYQDNYDTLVIETRLKAKKENKMRQTHKISAQVVREIRMEIELSNIQMGKKYGIDPNTVRRIRKGESRGGKDVDDPQVALTLLELGRESARRYAEQYGIEGAVERKVVIERNEGEPYLDYMMRKGKEEEDQRERKKNNNFVNPMDNPELGISHESFKLPKIEE